MVWFRAEAEGVGDIFEEGCDGATMVATNHDAISGGFIGFNDGFKGIKGLNAIIAFTGICFGEIFIAEATVKCVVWFGGFWFGQGEDGGIEFFKEGQRIYGANGVNVKPITGDEDILDRVIG